jgi:hypothetical protein
MMDLVVIRQQIVQRFVEYGRIAVDNRYLCFPYMDVDKIDVLSCAAIYGSRGG